MFYHKCNWNRKQKDMPDTAPLHRMVITNIYSKVVTNSFQLI